MVESIRDPLPECRLRKECVLLTEYIELRIPVQDARGNELVENPDDQRWEYSEEDIVQRECPGLKRRLAREIIEEGELHYYENILSTRSKLNQQERTQNCVMYRVMFL